MRRAPKVLYDPERDEIWLLMYFGWVEGWMAVTDGKFPMTAMTIPDHFIFLGYL